MCCLIFVVFDIVEPVNQRRCSTVAGIFMQAEPLVRFIVNLLHNLLWDFL